MPERDLSSKIRTNTTPPSTDLLPESLEPESSPKLFLLPSKETESSVLLILKNSEDSVSLLVWLTMPQLMPLDCYLPEDF